MAITITLNQIRKFRPCPEGWEKLLASLGKKKADDEQFPFAHIIKSNGLDDAIWALRCLDDPTPSRLFAVACAQSVLHLMQDERSINAVKVAHLFAHGEATREEIKNAADAADAIYAAAAADAIYAADAEAAAAVYAAIYAAAVYTAAAAAVYAAAAAAAVYAAAAAAADAIYAAAVYAAAADARNLQEKILLAIVNS